jgi:surface antigen
MGVGHMFRMLLLSSVLLLGACSTVSTNSPVSSNMTVNSNYNHVGNSAGSNLYRIIENTVWRMPKEAASKHTQTVYFAINNLYDGERMTWQDAKSNTSGSVKIVMTETYGGSYCRLLNSQVWYETKTRNLSEYACSTDSGNSWTFRPY